jgi:branched-chain amino acid transport system permease protein
MYGQLFVNGLIVGFSYALVAVSFGLIYSTAGFFHFAHAAVYSFASYLLYTLTATLSFPPIVGIPLSIGTAAALGAAIQIFIYGPLVRRGSNRAILLLSSLGIMVVFQNLISMMFGDVTLVVRHSNISEGMTVLGARITAVQIMTIALGVALPLATSLWLQLSRTGRMMRAVANEKELSTIVGIKVERTIILAFMIGSGIAAVAAILSAYDTDLTPLMGFRAVLFGAVAAIVGGIGSVPGALCGGLLIGFSQTFGGWMLPTQWQDTVVFLILILFLILRPQGFLGTPRTNRASP